MASSEEYSVRAADLGLPQLTAVREPLRPFDRAPTFRPANTAVVVRVGDEWRPGVLTGWYRPPHGSWLARIRLRYSRFVDTEHWYAAEPGQVLPVAFTDLPSGVCDVGLAP